MREEMGLGADEILRQSLKQLLGQEHVSCNACRDLLATIQKLVHHCASTRGCQAHNVGTSDAQRLKNIHGRDTSGERPRDNELERECNRDKERMMANNIIINSAEKDFRIGTRAHQNHILKKLDRQASGEQKVASALSKQTANPGGSRSMGEGGHSHQNRRNLFHPKKLWKKEPHSIMTLIRHA